jgi:hypothetical protein
MCGRLDRALGEEERCRDLVNPPSGGRELRDRLLRFSSESTKQPADFSVDGRKGPARPLPAPGLVLDQVMHDGG